MAWSSCQERGHSESRVYSDRAGKCDCSLFCFSLQSLWHCVCVLIWKQGRCEVINIGGCPDILTNRFQESDSIKFVMEKLNA
jgi:hypothetical protein